jgi:hypothetical protein
MKFLMFLLIGGFCGGAFANADVNCKSSAIQYVVNIVSAPYKKDPKFRFDKSQLKVVAQSSEGDGAESYENFTIAQIGSSTMYKLKLYVEEIGGVCPLEKYEVTYN